MYDEIMVLWEFGRIEAIAVYLNARGIYSAQNTTNKNKRGDYTWETRVANGVTLHDLVVQGINGIPGRASVCDRATKSSRMLKTKRCTRRSQ